MDSVKGSSVVCRGAVPYFASKVECWSDESFVKEGEYVSVGSPGVTGESLEKCELFGGRGCKFGDVMRPFEASIECETQKDWILFVGQGNSVEVEFGDCVGGIVLISGEGDGGAFCFGWVSAD